MSKNTPAPWHWNGSSLVSGKHGYYLMHTEECPGLGHAAEANKRLIAAAPELLEALKPFKDLAHAILAESPADATYFSIFQDCQGIAHRIDLDHLRAISCAIAKAEGRS